MTEIVTGGFAPPVHPDRVSRSRIVIIRAVALLLVAVASVVLAVVFADHGVRVDTFPPYVPGVTETHIKQFSGPWITGAFGLVALAGLLIVAAISDLRGNRPNARPTAPRVGPAGAVSTVRERGDSRGGGGSRCPAVGRVTRAAGSGRHHAPSTRR